MTTKAKTKSKSATQLTIIDAPQDAASRMLSMIERSSIDPRCNVEKMRALLDMQKEMIAEVRRVQFSEAMAMAQGEMDPVARADRGEKHKYAKLERIDREIRPFYIKAGFTLSFTSEPVPNGGIKITCKCRHKGGCTEDYELSSTNLDTAGAKGTANKTDIQGLGSTVSYLRRYLTCMIFNVIITDEDDDGKGSAVKKKNDFHEAAQAQSTPSSKIIEGESKEVEDEEEKPWDQQTLILPGGNKKQAWPNLEAAAHQIKLSMTAFNTKKARVEIINRNLPCLRFMMQNDKQNLVDELHAFAGEGK